MSQNEKKMMECQKCCGTGYIPHYAGIANGVCFTCAGNGVVAYRVKKTNKFSPIHAMHCRTLREAQEFRMVEFTNRFPELAARLTGEAKYKIENGCGRLKEIVEELQLAVA